MRRASESANCPSSDSYGKKTLSGTPNPRSPVPVRPGVPFPPPRKHAREGLKWLCNTRRPIKPRHVAYRFLGDGQCATESAVIFHRQSSAAVISYGCTRATFVDAIYQPWSGLTYARTRAGLHHRADRRDYRSGTLHGSGRPFRSETSGHGGGTQERPSERLRHQHGGGASPSFTGGAQSGRSASGISCRYRKKLT